MLTNDTLIKVLGTGRMPRLGKKEPWPDIGEWHSVSGPLRACENGLHITMIHDVHWLLVGAADAELYLVEYDKNEDYQIYTQTYFNIVAQKARLLKKLHYSLTDFLEWTTGDTVVRWWSWSECLLRYLNERNGA